MPRDSTEFPIEVRRVAHYFRLRLLLPLLLFALFLSMPTMIVIERGATAHSLVFIPFYAAFLALLVCIIWLPAKQASALRYWLEGSTLRIDEGLMIRRRKSIPLDRITDIALVQGPCLRLCGIWALQIQTAGSAQQAPEGTLYGLVDAESTRNTVMRARDAAVGADARGQDH